MGRDGLSASGCWLLFAGLAGGAKAGGDGILASEGGSPSCGCALPGVPSEPPIELNDGIGADGCSGSLAPALRRGMRADMNFVIDDLSLVPSGAFVGCASPGVPSKPSVELEGDTESDGCSGPLAPALRRGRRADTNFVIDDLLLVRSPVFESGASPSASSEPSVEMEGGTGEDGCSGPLAPALRRGMRARIRLVNDGLSLVRSGTFVG